MEAKPQDVAVLQGAGEKVVEIKGLSKAFDGNSILHDLDFYLKRGENAVVLGKSGTGKSVLIKCLVGLIHPDTGTLKVFGEDLMKVSAARMNSFRKRIGFLFQSAALYDSMTVNENLLFPLRVEKGLGAEEKDKLVDEALSNVGLLEAKHKMPSELSGGMRKRIGLARTLILKPEIILYDEPTTGLDPVTSKEISHLILDMQQKYNTSSIIITHDMACARIVANRIVVLRHGHFVAEGTFEELEHHQDAWISAFFENI
jgi:phospholipid/cholesterol/gamma-HCH transport system ATP-binding protein